jgi:hypothetical protein
LLTRDCCGLTRSLKLALCSLTATVSCSSVVWHSLALRSRSTTTRSSVHLSNAKLMCALRLTAAVCSCRLPSDRSACASGSARHRAATADLRSIHCVAHAISMAMRASAASPSFPSAPDVSSPCMSMPGRTTARGCSCIGVSSCACVGRPPGDAPTTSDGDAKAAMALRELAAETTGDIASVS